jgi:thiamine-monophosphate kinase
MRRTPSTLTSKSPKGELAILEQIRHRAGHSAKRSLSLGIGDDCALIRVKTGEEITITTDLSIAGRHFRLDWHPAEAIGHRTLARGLSDTAAMGARPVAAFLSLGLPRELTVKRGRNAAWIDSFLDGFLALAAKHQIPLAGGDMAQSPVPVADIVLLGAVPRGKALLRSGARPGELIYVTGTLGGAAAGLALLGQMKSRSAALLKKNADRLTPHLWPQPRIQQGLWLQRRGAVTAAIDISDGLSTEIGHICDESGVAAEVNASALPIHPGAILEQALHGGEDYELLFTAPAHARMPKRIGGVSVTCIGKIVKWHPGQTRVTLATATGRHPLVQHGWEHFS